MVRGECERVCVSRGEWDGGRGLGEAMMQFYSTESGALRVVTAVGRGLRDLS